MEKKILTLEVKYADWNYMIQTTGGFKEPLFAFVHPPKGGYMKAATDLVYCRESFCEYLRQDLRGVSHNDINTNKLHMVVHRRVIKTPSKLDRNLAIFREQVLAAQSMLNVIEKNYGWPLTKIYPAQLGKDQEVAANNAFYYVVASKRWIKAPAMLSLFTLIFRIAAYNGKFKFGSKIKNIKTFYSALEDASLKSGESELAFFREHGSFWPLVLDNYNKLFSKRSIEDLYCPKDADYFFSEGINTLCDLDTKDSKLRGTFEGIVKKARSHLFK